MQTKLILFHWTGLLLITRVIESVVVFIDPSLQDKLIQKIMIQLNDDQQTVDDDPFDSHPECRKESCETVMTASKYVVVEKDATRFDVKFITRERMEEHNIQDTERWIREHADRNTNEAIYKCRNIRLKEDEYYSVKMLPCLSVNSSIVYLLVYGFNDSHRYIYQYIKLEDEVDEYQFEGLAETTPTIHTTVDGQPLFQYLDTTLARNNSKSIFRLFRMQDSLCKVDMVDHLRICGLVLDALSQDDSHYKSQPAHYMKRTKAKRKCSKRKVYDHSKTSASFEVEALPCAVDTLWSSPQFYLVRDPTPNTFGLFVLQCRPYEKHKIVPGKSQHEDVLNVTNYITDVSALKYP